jgi:hypothetical protein
MGIYIMKVAIIDKNTLDVYAIYKKTEDADKIMRIDFPEETHTFVDVSDDVTIKNIKVNSDGTTTTDQAYLYDELRQKRNALLVACDWTQARDSPLTLEQQDTWSTYRQALRDLPANTPDPTNVTWPTPPQ